MSAPDRRELVLAALRGLDLPPAELKAKLFAASPKIREALQSEMDALQWLRAAWIVGDYSNVAPAEVFDYLQAGAAGEVAEEVAA